MILAVALKIKGPHETVDGFTRKTGTGENLEESANKLGVAIVAENDKGVEDGLSTQDRDHQLKSKREL